MTDRPEETICEALTAIEDNSKYYDRSDMVFINRNARKALTEITALISQLAALTEVKESLVSKLAERDNELAAARDEARREALEEAAILCGVAAGGKGEVWRLDDDGQEVDSGIVLDRLPAAIRALIDTLSPDNRLDLARIPKSWYFWALFKRQRSFRCQLVHDSMDMVEADEATLSAALEAACEKARKAG
jgi:hypothetical protein